MGIPTRAHYESLCELHGLDAAGQPVSETALTVKDNGDAQSRVKEAARAGTRAGRSAGRRRRGAGA